MDRRQSNEGDGSTQCAYVLPKGSLEHPPWVDSAIERPLSATSLYGRLRPNCGLSGPTRDIRSKAAFEKPRLDPDVNQSAIAGVRGATAAWSARAM
jgi:hypothetical protein